MSDLRMMEHVEDILSGDVRENIRDEALRADAETEAWKARAEEAEAELDGLREQLITAQAKNRSAAQALIVEIGAPGPETLAETVTRAIRELRRFRQERNELRKLGW